MGIIIQYILNGISMGSIYALTAIGYSLVYSILGLINMSHAAVFMTSAIIFYAFFNFVSGGLPLWMCFIFTLVTAGLLGWIIERVAIRPIRIKGDGMTYALIASIGVKIILEKPCQGLFGSEIKPFPTILEGKYIDIFGARMAAIQIIIIAMTLIILASMNWFTQKTKQGRALRALSQNLEACYLMGIPVNTMISLGFVIGSMLAAIAGIFYCMYYSSVMITISANISSKAFAATVLGGIGALKGSVIGGFLLGIIEMITAALIGAEYRNMIAFCILIAVLIFRPTGLFGQKEQKKV
ncbi:MAG: branched-chain amino acid ABC transporter permease [Bulleidia sp.]